MPLHPRFNEDDVFVVLATTDLPNPLMTLDEKREGQTTATRLIQAKYHAEIPFFLPRICFGTWYGNWKAIAMLTRELL